MVPDLSDMEAMPDAPAEPAATTANPSGGDPAQRRAMMERYGRFMTQKPAADPAAPKKTGASNEVGMLTLTCEAVNLKASSPTANDLMVFTFQDKLKSMTNLFDSKETTLSGSITLTNITDATFTFDVNLKLKRPVKL
jgi:hypothetical protein